MTDKICEYAKKKYGSDREFLWKNSNNSVIRRNDNKKWYAVFITVPRFRLGLEGNEPIDIADIKCDPIIAGSLRSKHGFLPAYHMNKSNWITVLLDGSIPLDEIFPLIDMSYNLADSAKRKRTSE